MDTLLPFNTKTLQGMYADTQKLEVQLQVNNICPKINPMSLEQNNDAKMSLGTNTKCWCNLPLTVSKLDYITITTKSYWATELLIAIGKSHFLS